MFKTAGSIVAMIAIALLLHVKGAGQDITSIERRLVKEPAYKSKPEYALLVFGPRAEKNVWLVRDGDILYVDRQSTGDLTVPEAKVKADTKSSVPEEDQYSFEIGSLKNCPGEPAEVLLSTRRLSTLPELTADMKKTVAQESNRVTFIVTLQTRHPHWKGTGIDGRLAHMAGPIDHTGALLFGITAATAPIIHFGGPLTIVTYGELPKVQVAGTIDFVTSVGTLGVGAGSTAFLGYEKVIPNAATPVIEITMPKTGDNPAYRELFELKERC